MRILILTHPRSGGLSFFNWICKEIGPLGYHEPDLNNKEILNDIYNNDNIVIKVFVENFKNIDLHSFIKTFDKVIIHKRNNTMDTAISSLKGLEVDNENNHNNWHKVYQVSHQWLEDNKDKIEVTKNKYDRLNKELDEVFVDGSLKTTYESLFSDKTGIDELCEYLDIKEPKWLDVLDSSHRLRDGTVGTSKYKKFINKDLI